MVPVPTEDFELDPPAGSFWQSLLNLAISVLVVCAAALIGSFLSATSAHARTTAKVAAKGESRIGYQKSASLFVLQKAQGSLERKLAPLGFGVKWIEFPAGPQLLEGLNVGAVDVGFVGEAHVDAWVIWDPFQAAAEKATGARALADGRPDVVNNDQYHLGARDVVERNPKVIEQKIADTFFELKLIPRAIKVADAVVVAKP